jgi:hypothetical protein
LEGENARNRRGVATLMRQLLGNFQLGFKFAIIAAVLVAIRAVLWELGVKGIAPSHARSSSRRRTG